MRNIYILLLSLGVTFFMTSCAWFQKPLDKMSGFSGYLNDIEEHIRNERWHEAATDLRKATKAWYKVKPFLQVDIDHDYVNTIEADFIRLRSAIETKEKPDGLSSVLLIEANWKNIDQM